MRMVKQIKVVPMGNPAAAEIVRMRDLVGSPQSVPAGVTEVAQAPDLYSSAKGAVNTLDQYIKLADQGVTMLGRLDSIFSRVQQIRAGPQAPAPGRGPGPAQLPPGPLMEAPAGMMINADPAHRAPPPVAAQPLPADPPAPAPAPASAAPAPKIPLGAIVQALDMIAGAQPGVTVADLSAAIKRNPNEVQHLLDTFAGSMK